MSKISVIIPVYNVEKYLAQCIDSVISQTYQDLEIILVDDGSTDSSSLICDKYAETDRRITVVHKVNGGLSEARNTGLDLAGGQYISFIDSDDFVSPDFYESLLQALTASQTNLACCGFLPFKSEEEIEWKSGMHDFETMPASYVLNHMDDIYTEPMVVVACNKLYKRSLFESIRFPVGKYHEDLFIFYRIFAMCDKVCYLKRNLYFYRQREESIMTMKEPVPLLKRQMDRIEARDVVLEFSRIHGLEGLYNYMTKARRNDLWLICENIPGYLIPASLKEEMDVTFLNASARERLRYMVVKHFRRFFLVLKKARHRVSGAD